MHPRTFAASLLAFFLSVSIFALARTGDKATVKGMIISRTGDMLIVLSEQGRSTVVVNDDTKTRDNGTVFGLYKEPMSDTVLIPGLRVEVQGISDDQRRIVAETITVDPDDLETAEMIQAGLHPTAEQVIANEQKTAANTQGIESNRQDIEAHRQALESHQQNIATHEQQIQRNIKDIEENTDRFTRLSEYEVKGQATVKFRVNSSEISEPDQEQLKELAQNAGKVTGYIVEVTGYTDSTGTAAINQQLSEDRAKAVVAYLIQQCGVPVRHIVAPGAMGMYQPTASNETPEGRAENRRVEVKVLINKGIAGN